jgi:hypothetical protein
MNIIFSVQPKKLWQFFPAILVFEKKSSTKFAFLICKPNTKREIKEICKTLEVRAKKPKKLPPS